MIRENQTLNGKCTWGHHRRCNFRGGAVLQVVKPLYGIPESESTGILLTSHTMWSTRGCRNRSLTNVSFTNSSTEMTRDSNFPSRWHVWLWDAFFPRRWRAGKVETAMRCGQSDIVRRHCFQRNNILTLRIATDENTFSVWRVDAQYIVVNSLQDVCSNAQLIAPGIEANTKHCRR